MTREAAHLQPVPPERSPGSAPEPTRTVSFCGHCGTRPEQETNSRVCQACSMGLLLECEEKDAPAKDAAFLVVDDCMSVCALSASAERLLATNETHAVNRHLTELLVPADVEASGPANLAVAVTWAARGAEGGRRVFVRPANTFGMRIAARIASCGPPKAALLVFE